MQYFAILGCIIYIYIDITNIKRNCDTLIQQNDNKTTEAFEHFCVLLQWCSVRKEREVFESFSRFIIVLLD